VNVFIIAGIGATVFFGGWMPLHIGNLEFFNNAMDIIPPVIWFFMKVAALLFLIMWFKWTFPRLRIDQMLTLEWKYLLPINLANILLMSVVSLYGWHF
jgi:NADH-quinone oxidoreductase subunit H